MNTNGSVAYLGIELDTQCMEGKSACQVVVKRVVLGSPAAKAGILPGDVVQSIGRTPLHDHSIVSVLSGYKPGDTITLKVVRCNRSSRVKITLGERQLPVLKFRPLEQMQAS
jgi:S1-C subfamily serine protease